MDSEEDEEEVYTGGEDDSPDPDLVEVEPRDSEEGDSSDHSQDGSAAAPYVLDAGMPVLWTG